MTGDLKVCLKHYEPGGPAAENQTAKARRTLRTPPRHKDTKAGKGMRMEERVNEPMYCVCYGGPLRNSALVATASAFLRDLRRSPWAFPQKWTRSKTADPRFSILNPQFFFLLG